MTEENISPVLPIYENLPEEDGGRFTDGFRILHGKQEYVTYREHSSIRVWSSEVPGHFDSHVHSAVEIILPHRGVSVYQLSDRVYRVHPGEVLIIPPGFPHMLTESGDIQRYLILFEPTPLLSLQDMLSVSAMTHQPMYLREDDELTEEAAALLMKVVETYFRREKMWNTACYAALLELYALLGRHYLQKTTPAVPPKRLSVDSELMNSAMTYISQNYMKELTLEEVASFAGFSKYYFSRVFKEFAGVSFSDYLTVRRLNASANLLTHTDLPIREVAKESGFGSVGSFNRIFREQKHCTPTQYRVIYGEASPAARQRPLVFSHGKV